MAFHDALGGHPAAFERAMHLDGLDGIGRAAWPETTARTQQGANGVLIDANAAHHQCGQQPATASLQGLPSVFHDVFGPYSVAGSIIGSLVISALSTPSAT